MPLFREQHPVVPDTGDAELCVSGSLPSSQSHSRLRFEAAEFFPAAAGSVEIAASDGAGGLGPAEDGRSQDALSFQCQGQTPINGNERVASKIKAYLLENSEQFCILNELRQLGWSDPAGDTYFKKQRQDADHATEKLERIFFNMMKDIGREMHQMTGGALAAAQNSTGSPAILDLCMAPGGFLATAMEINPTARALGISLPVEKGGHKVRIPAHGRPSIPPEHPDAENFLPRQFRPEDAFDLVICDGQVLRTHDRAAYREKKEAHRLTVAQLAIGLEHLRPGGTMIVLLHRVESTKSVGLLYAFKKFSSVQLFKPGKHHSKRSSFYMVVRDVRSRHPDAIAAVTAWKRQWEAATFGTDEEFEGVLREEYWDVEQVLEEFGPALVGLGREVWAIQADGLRAAPWMKKHGKK